MENQAINEIILNAVDKTYLISITDKKGTIVYANTEFCLISGYTEQELIGQDHRILNSKKHCNKMWRDMWERIYKGEVFEADIINKAKDNSLYCVRTKIYRVSIKEKTYYISLRTLVNDILESKRRREKVIKKLNKI